jgi:hypothetical protein
LTDGHTWLLFIDGHQQQTLPKKKNDQRASITRHNSCAHFFGKLLLLLAVV